MPFRTVLSRTLLIPLAVLLASAGLVAGCGSSDSSSGSDSNGSGNGQQANEQQQSGNGTGGQNGEDGNSQGNGNANLTGNTADAVKALGTIEQKFKDGIPYDLERTTHKGSDAWEIKVAFDKGKPLEFKVSADGKKILSQSKHKRDDDVDKATQTSMPLSKAISFSAKKTEGDLDEAEIDKSDGKVVWTVTFKDGDTEHEAYVNARTGKLVRVKTEKD